MIPSDLEELIHDKPKTREQLLNWWNAFVDLPILTQSRCSHLNHNSQADYICDAFFNRYGYAVVKAARHAGKSYSAAIACFLDCFFKPGIEIVVMGKTLKQSGYIHKEMVQILLRFREKTGIHAATYKPHGGATFSDIAFANGSSVAFHTGSGRVGARGAHPSVIILDEADEFDEEFFDSLDNGISVTDKFPTRVDLLSTNYSLEGDGLICAKEAEYEDWNAKKSPADRAKNVYRICLIDALKNCGDEYQCATCSLHKYCQGKAKTVPTDGFYSISTAREKFGDKNLATVESELLLLKPTPKNAFFSDFDTDQNVTALPFVDGLPTYINFDFGAGRLPSAATVVQIDKDSIYRVPLEFRGLIGERLGSFLARIKERYPQSVTWGCYYDPAGNRRDGVNRDSERDELIRSGFTRAYTTTAVKRAESFQQLQSLIKAADGSRKLLIDKGCTNLIRQIQAARHRVEQGKVLKEPHDPKDDHELDTLRYCVSITHKILAAKRQPRMKW